MGMHVAHLYKQLLNGYGVGAHTPDKGGSRRSTAKQCQCLRRAEPQKGKHIEADPNSARSRKIAAKKAKAKEVREAKKKAAKARKQRAAERAEQPNGTGLRPCKINSPKSLSSTCLFPGHALQGI